MECMDRTAVDTHQFRLRPCRDVVSVDDRFTPESERLMRCREMTLWATSDILHCSKIASYSITSSASANAAMTGRSLCRLLEQGQNSRIPGRRWTCPFVGTSSR